MTVDECAKILSGRYLKLTTIALGEETDTTAEEVSASIIDSLRALLRTESDRCAAKCNRLGDEFMAKSKGEPLAAYNRSLVMAGPCYELRDEILRTSPGGGG